MQNKEQIEIRNQTQADPKKTYVQPQLVRHGMVEELTQGTGIQPHPSQLQV